jgi:8-oxo-dGTP pyrophosphatase MutT (NUDIX family)
MAARTGGAGVFLPTPDGRVLGISRGTNLKDLTFPGGRRDPEDASLAHTAARELQEETGVVVAPEDLQLILEDKGRTTFYAPYEAASWPAKLRSQPFEGYVALWPPAAFYGSGCQWADHQLAVIEAYGLTYGYG